MPKQLQRTGVEKLPEVQRSKGQVQPVDTFVQTREPEIQKDESTRIAEGLFEFSGQAMDYSVREAKKKIDLDKVTQQQRALRGLDPTDDATKAGIRSYQVIQMRDDVLEANAELTQKIRDNPDLTDDEFEEMTRESYAPLLDQYQPDAQLSQALTNKLQESQTQIHQVRNSVQREHHEWKQQETFSKSIEEYREAAASEEELVSSLQPGGQLSNEADALGLSEEQKRTMLIQFAQRDAANGDGRILGALDKTGWASRDSRVEKARSEFEAWQQEAYAVEIGSEWGRIQMARESRQASWTQTEEAIKRLNNKFPGTISAKQVASLRRRSLKSHSAEDKARAAEASYYKGVQNGASSWMEGNPLYTDDQRDAVRDGFSTRIQTQARHLVAEGKLEEEDAQTFVLQESLRFSRKTGLELDSIGDAVSALDIQSPDDWEGEGIPAQVTPGLTLASQMSNEDIERYGSNERTKNLIRNYQDAISKPGPDRDAWLRAHRIQSANENLSPEEKSQVRDDADKRLNKVLSDRKGWFDFGVDDVTEGAMRRLRSDSLEEVNIKIGSGGTPNHSVEPAVKNAASRRVILDNGTDVGTSQQNLSRYSAYEENGVTYALDANSTNDAFEVFFEENKDSFQEESFFGEDLTSRDVHYRVTDNGLVSVVDNEGQPLLDGQVSLQDINKLYQSTAPGTKSAEAMRKARERSDREPYQPAYPSMWIK